MKTTGLPGVWKNCEEELGVPWNCPVRTGSWVGCGLGNGLEKVLEVVARTELTGDTDRVGNGLVVALAVVLFCVVLLVVLCVVLLVVLCVVLLLVVLTVVVVRLVVI